MPHCYHPNLSSPVDLKHAPLLLPPGDEKMSTNFYFDEPLVSHTAISPVVEKTNSIIYATDESISTESIDDESLFKDSEEEP
jgi:hypothetical protein